MGRTGAFALLYAAVQEVEAGNGIPELPQLVRRMRQQRKHMLQEKVSVDGWGLGRDGPCLGVMASAQPTRSNAPLQLHLRFCHEAVVRHVEQVLQRHGVPPPCKTLASMSVSQKVRKVPWAAGTCESPFSPILVFSESPSSGLPGSGSRWGRAHQLHPGHHCQAQHPASRGLGFPCCQHIWPCRTSRPTASQPPRANPSPTTLLPALHFFTPA